MQYESYRLKSDQTKDPVLSNLMRPYSDSVAKSMNEIIGINESRMTKKLPESSLGNFMTDAILIMAREKFGKHVDVAFVNYGGIRLDELPQGPVTRGKIFELMPFDNLLVLQELKGDKFQELLDLTASDGGWPVAGLSMRIRNKKAIDVMIGGKPLDPGAYYIIANSDYVANGNGAEMLKNFKQESIGYLLRDALIDYVKLLKLQGKSIDYKLENRVVHAG